MKTGLVLQVVSTFECAPIASSLLRVASEAGIADAVGFTSPFQLGDYMLAPSEDSEQVLGTIVLVRVEDWLRDAVESLSRSSPDSTARQMLRQHFDEFLSQLSVLALRGRPVWLLVCPSAGWVSEQCKLVTLCRTMTNLFSARARNLSQVVVLNWPSSLTTDEHNDREADKVSHIPFTPGAFDQLGESVATQLARILASSDPNAASAPSTRSPELAAFLNGLRVQVKVVPAQPGDRPHVDRILRTAASFSLAGEKPTISNGEIDAILKSKNCYLVAVSDRLSDYGPTGVVVAGASGDALVVDVMSLSCVVLGKQVEYALVSALAQIATEKHLSRIAFEFRPSGRNQPTLAFLKSVAETRPDERYTIAVNDVDASIQDAAVAPGAWNLKVVADQV